LDLVLRLLGDAKELGVQSVTWTGGGEPGVYRHLPQAIAAAAALQFRQGLNTNGSVSSDSLAALLTQHFTYVRFSVDAGTPETYARTHRVRPQAFETVTGNIRALVRRRDAAGSPLTIGFSFLVDTSNVDDLSAAAHLARALGVDYFQIKPITHYVESNLQFAAHSPLWDRLERQLEEVSALESERFRLRFLGHKFRDIREQQAYYGRSYDECRGNELLASVGADGSVDVCCAYKGQAGWSFGNLHERSFAEIWAGDERRRVLARIDVHQCPPLCKAHEINKVLHYARHFDAHREFI
jgi:MoaA/NifB/PqqE/SkfB family radical SAM enzyme